MDIRTRALIIIGAAAVLGCEERPTTGTLVVDVTGLPLGANAAVSVVGPNQFSQEVTATTTLEHLPPGDYTVRVFRVRFESALYSAAAATQSYRIAAGHTDAARIRYALSSASVDLSISGLPDGAPASVVLSCAACTLGGYTRTVSSGGVVTELPVGEYEIRADTVVTAEGDRFGPTSLRQTLSLPASVTPVPMSVTYQLASGSLALMVSGLPTAQSPPPVIISAPGFTRATSVSETLRGLKPGSYTIAAKMVTSACPDTYQPAVAQQTVDVSAGATSAVTVSYSHTQLPASSLNLRIDNIHLLQVVQDYEGTTPMIAGKKALLRVFGIANQCNTAQPRVRLTFSDGTVTMLDRAEAMVRTSTDEGSITSTWNVTLSADRVKPGLALFAEIDPTNAVAEANETDNRFPATGFKTIDVRQMPTVGVRFVPVVIANQTGNADPARFDDLLLGSRRLHPVSGYDADARASALTSSASALTSSGGGWSQVLSELNAAHTADTGAAATNRYYVGMVRVGYNSGVAGVAYVGGKTALSWDYLPSASEIIAHELGHAFGRFHAPCGNPAGTDESWPQTGSYVGGYIGTYGYDVSDGLLRPPSVYTDIMGYCSTKWISDYTYKGMMQWLENHPVSLPVVTSAAIQRSLLVWGRIENGRPVLEPAFEIDARPSLPTGGPHRLVGVDASGADLFSVAFGGETIADLPGEPETFAFAVPLSMLRGRELGALRVTANGRTVSSAAAGEISANADVALTRVNDGAVRVQWDATRFPAVMVRDPASGDVLSFAKGGSATIATASSQLEVVYSNRLRSGRVIRRLK